MFDALDSSTFLDVFRIPYRVDGRSFAATTPDRHPLLGHAGIATAADGTSVRRLHWMRRGGLGLSAPLEARLGHLRLFGSVLPDRTAADWLGSLGGGWERASVLTDRGGHQIASVWRAVDGSVLLPFDPDDVVLAYWSEAYLALRGGRLAPRAWDRAVNLYYRARPFVPRKAQLALRRALTRVQGRSPFPAWPIETALHDLYEFLLSEVSLLTSHPVPWIGFWPRGYDWALVLTHDVETDVGLRNLDVLLSLETAAGLRSSWNLVPKRYDVPDQLVRTLSDEGFEIGVHGLYHDGFDIRPAAKLRERLPEMRAYAERWRAVGFRAPATHRDWRSMSLLGFEYDSSYSDTAPHEPQPGGCCTWLPVTNDEIVELPITVPQDHTVFNLLGEKDATLWLEKIEFLKNRGGLALLLTHPDYMLEGPGRQAYSDVLQKFGNDPHAWTPLPRDVASWWRRREESHLEPASDGWRVVGPAADEAVVQLRPSSRLG